MILAYHHIAPRAVIPQQSAKAEGWECVHTPEALAFHVRALRLLRYRLVSLDSYVSQIETNGSPAPRTAVVTFDDGWIDNHTYAFPLLVRLAVPATFFATSDHISSGVDDPRKMGRDELRELQKMGMTIGAHSRTHPDLTQLSDSCLWQEVAGSREDIEATVDAPVRFFAYPGGSFNQKTVEAVKKAGYSAACTSLGPAANTRSTLSFMYRDGLTSRLTSPGDWYRISRVARKTFEYRVRRRLAEHIAGEPLIRSASSAGNPCNKTQDSPNGI